MIRTTVRLNTNFDFFFKIVKLISETRSVCDVKLVYDIGLSASLTDSIANMQDVLCSSPNELYNDVKKVFSIASFETVCQIFVCIFQ